MKNLNLENFGVQEMDAKEMNDVQAGVWIISSGKTVVRGSLSGQSYETGIAQIIKG